MHIIARSTLHAFVAKLAGHRDQRAVKSALDHWYYEVKNAKWQTSADIKQTFANASIISADRVVFNIKGNSYRLIAAILYRKGFVYIKWLGTHREYDKIDARTVEYDP